MVALDEVARHTSSTPSKPTAFGAVFLQPIHLGPPLCIRAGLRPSISAAKSQWNSAGSTGHRLGLWLSPRGVSATQART